MKLTLPVSHHLSLFVELGPAHHADVQLGPLSFSPLSSLQAHEKILEKISLNFYYTVRNGGMRRRQFKRPKDA
jgi:hypothetical protein